MNDYLKTEGRNCDNLDCQYWDDSGKYEQMCSAGIDDDDPYIEECNQYIPEKIKLEGRDEEERIRMRLPVAGAGELIFKAPFKGYIKTGTAKGMSVNVTWGKYGEAGGVMDIDDLQKLAEGINEWLENLGHSKPNRPHKPC